MSPVKIMQTTPTRGASGGTEIKDDLVKFYKESGLEPVAKEVVYTVAIGISWIFMIGH